MEPVASYSITCLQCPAGALIVVPLRVKVEIPTQDGMVVVVGAVRVQILLRRRRENAAGDAQLLRPQCRRVERLEVDVADAPPMAPFSSGGRGGLCFVGGIVGWDGVGVEPLELIKFQ